MGAVIKPSAQGSSSLEHNFSTILTPVHFFSSIISSISSRVARVGSIFVAVFQKPVEKDRLEALENKVEQTKDPVWRKRQSRRRRR